MAFNWTDIQNGDSASSVRTSLNTLGNAAESFGNTNTLNFTNVTVPTSLWQPSTTYTQYPYQANISCTGVTTSYIAYVNFAPTDALSGILGIPTLCGSGVVVIYATKQPTSAITIPTINCMEAL